MFPAAAARKSTGKQVGEHKSGMGKLTEGLVCAKEGRRWELDGEGEAPRERQWRTTVCGSISAEVELKRARGGS